jgi:hypothetical protein
VVRFRRAVERHAAVAHVCQPVVIHLQPENPSAGGGELIGVALARRMKHHRRRPARPLLYAGGLAMAAANDQAEVGAGVRVRPKAGVLGVDRLRQCERSDAPAADARAEEPSGR